jgi:hypothetical protein
MMIYLSKRVVFSNFTRRVIEVSRKLVILVSAITALCILGTQAFATASGSGGSGGVDSYSLPVRASAQFSVKIQSITQTSNGLFKVLGVITNDDPSQSDFSFNPNITLTFVNSTRQPEYSFEVPIRVGEFKYGETSQFEFATTEDLTEIDQSLDALIAYAKGE